MPRVIFIAIVASLFSASPAFALRMIMTGNAPLGSEHGLSKEVLAAFNMPERVILSEGGLGGTYDVYFHGGPKALNEALRRFAAIKARKHEVTLMPFSAKPFEFAKKSYPYDWTIHIATERPDGQRTEPELVTMVVRIPNVSPPALSDAATARKCIGDLGDDNFKVRERAAKELAALGTSAARLYREALKGDLTPEARERLERLLADVTKEICVDSL